MEVRQGRQATSLWARMRMRAVAVLVAASLGFASFASAQVSDSAGIAYVDLTRVLDQAPQVAAARAGLEEEFRERNRQLEEEQLSVEALKQQIADERSLTSTANADLQRRVESMERGLKRKREALSRDLDSRRQSELATIDALIGEAISELARERKLDLVLTDQVVYYSPRIDLTDSVINRLRQSSELQR